MSKKAVFIIDPWQSLDRKKDTSLLLMSEACLRGWTVVACEIQGVIDRSGQVFFRGNEVSVPPELNGNDRLLGEVFLSGEETTAVFIRKDPPFNQNYLNMTWLLDHLPKTCQVLNTASCLRNMNEKLSTFRFPQWIVPSCVSSDVETLECFVEESPGQVVLKPLNLFGGQGIVLVRKNDPDLHLKIEQQLAVCQEAIMAQFYIPEVSKGDKRIVLVDGEPVGVMVRKPKEGEFRSNLMAGGRPEPATFNDRDLAIVETLKPVLKKEGAVLVGLDVVGGYLNEINVTSPTGLRQINQFMGISIQKNVLDFVEARC